MQKFTDEFKRLMTQNESASLSQLIERARTTVDEVKPTNQIAPKNLADATSKVLEIIPADKFISDEEILDRLDDIEPNELPEIMLTLQIQGLVEENAGNYKRTATAPQPTTPAEIRGNTAEIITGSRTAHQIQYRVVEADALTSSHTIERRRFERVAGDLTAEQVRDIIGTQTGGAKMGAAMANGTAHQYDLSTIAEAVKKLSALRDEGKTVANFLQEQSLFADQKFSDEAREILTVLDSNKRAPKKIAAFFLAERHSPRRYST